jgi:uncharacterized phage protein gp47/JayE
MSGVTSQGFENKQYSEIVNDLATKAKTPTYFGEQFPVTPDSVFGVLAGLFSAALKDQWDLSGSVADQGNRDKAAGKYLDDLAALIGLTRLLASGSTGVLLFTGVNSTVVPINTPIKSTSNKETVLTTSSLTLNRTACYQTRVNIPFIVVGQTYTVTVNGTAYSEVAVTSQSVLQLSTLLAAQITSGGGALYSASYQTSTGNILITSGTTNNNLLTSNSGNVNLVSVSSLVEAKAATSGSINFFTGTLTTIVSPIIGITSVNNPSDFSVGRNEETDAELRVRMEDREQSTGTATKPSIEASLSEVDGVTLAYVIENTTLTPDVDSRPAKSYETYVAGGLDSAIAKVVWETKPAGIETWGDTSVVVVDHNGDDQLVKFSRFSFKYAWVRVTYSINSEEEFFPDGESLIKAAVVETGSKFYRGEDLEPTKFYGNIYSKVSGIFVSKIEVAITDAPLDTPTYTGVRIPVNKVTNLLFSTDRVPLLT